MGNSSHPNGWGLLAQFKMKLIKKGKVKDIYDLGDNKILFIFSNRVSAFDVILPSMIPFKGEILCRLSAFWFNFLDIPNHLLEIIRPNKLVVRKLNVIPIECVVRGYVYGSLYERIQKGEVKLLISTLAAKLPEPFFDPTTKFEKKDRVITKEEIIAKKWLSEEEFEWIKQKSVEIYAKMLEKANKVGFILADVKFEFGKTEEGKILLADSIGPDEFRLWSKENYSPGKKQESFDKQPVRDWLIKVGYKNALDEARKMGKPLPKPPKLPEELIKEVSKKYIYVFEELTGEKFR